MPKVQPVPQLLRRSLNRYGRLDRGWWRFIVGNDPHICCPQCGTICDLTGREVNALGDVRGLVECERDGCSWQAFVRLGGYEYRR